MFKKMQGKTKFMYYPVTVSTTFSEGGLVSQDVGTGTLIETTATSAGATCLGVIRHAITASDDNYATARSVEVEVPVEKNVIWKCTTVGTGTAAAADLGTYADIDDNLSIDVDNSTYDIFFITAVVTASATAGAADVRGILNIGPESLGVAGD